MYTKNGVSFVIPCLNEFDSIKYVLQILIQTANKHVNKYEIIVADNGSTDGTLDVVKKFKKVRIVYVPIRGYGAALHYGILTAKYPYVLFADADASYDFSQLIKFLPLMNKGFDVILGSRLSGEIESGAMPLLNRYIGTPVLSFLIRKIYSIPTSDCNSGMRAVKVNFYKHLGMKNSGMEWASELLIKSKLQKGTYAEVPIIFFKDKRGRKPHLHRWEDGWRHFKVIILLKPSLFIFFAIIIAGIGIAYLPFSVFTTISLFLFSEFLLFSYLASKKLQSAITGSYDWVSAVLDRMQLLIIGMLLTIGGFLCLILISDNHIFTKYILISQVLLFDLWLFFIETIKTHVSNPLPKSIKCD